MGERKECEDGEARFVALILFGLVLGVAYVVADQGDRLTALEAAQKGD